MRYPNPPAFWGAPHPPVPGLHRMPSPASGIPWGTLCPPPSFLGSLTAGPPSAGLPGAAAAPPPPRPPWHRTAPGSWWSPAPARGGCRRGEGAGPPPAPAVPAPEPAAAPAPGNGHIWGFKGSPKPLPHPQHPLQFWFLATGTFGIFGSQGLPKNLSHTHSTHCSSGSWEWDTFGGSGVPKSPLGPAVPALEPAAALVPGNGHIWGSGDPQNLSHSHSTCCSSGSWEWDTLGGLGIPRAPPAPAAALAPPTFGVREGLGQNVGLGHLLGIGDPLTHAPQGSQPCTGGVSMGGVPHWLGGPGHTRGVPALP